MPTEILLSPGRITAFRRKWFRGFSPVPMTLFSRKKGIFAGLKTLVGFRLKPVLRPTATTNRTSRNFGIIPQGGALGLGLSGCCALAPCPRTFYTLRSYDCVV